MAPTILLLDIEGTTTSISFVHDILFPYVTKALEEYLNTNWNSKLLNEDIELLRVDAINEHQKGNLDMPLISANEMNENDEAIKDAIIKNVRYQMSIDRKSNSLKTLQGHIWSKGYEDGDLIGHVFQDVPSAFRRWTSIGIKLYIYSSGSVEAQKLLFGHTSDGSLLTYISGHFDTKIGSKIDSSSYTNILKELNTTPDNVLFLTDVLKEAKASRSAGIESVIVIRPGNHAIESNELEMFKSINSFDELDDLFQKR